MTRDASHEDRLARLAARGRVRTSDPTRRRANPSMSAAPSSAADQRSMTPRPGAAPWAAPAPPASTPPYPGASGASAVYPGPTDAGGVDPGGGTYPMSGGPPTAPYPRHGFNAPAGPAPTRRTTSSTRPAAGRHHPARRSRLVTAGVSTALMFAGIGYLSATQVFAGTQPAASQGADPAALTTSGAATDGQPADDQPGRDDPVSIVVPATAEPAGTLPPTVAQAPASASSPTTLGPAPASIAAAAVDPAAVEPAADPAVVDPAAVDPAVTEAPTDPPTTVRRTPRTAAPRPRCTGSHC